MQEPSPGTAGFPFALTSVQETCLEGLHETSFPKLDRSFKCHFKHLDASSGSLIIFISARCCLCRALLQPLHSGLNLSMELARTFWEAQGGCWHERRKS